MPASLAAQASSKQSADQSRGSDLPPAIAPQCVKHITLHDSSLQQVESRHLTTELSERDSYEYADDCHSSVVFVQEPLHLPPVVCARRGHTGLDQVGDLLIAS